MNNASVKNIHATAVALQGKGILLLGDSGSGKSDLALRLIENKGAVLVADDRVDLSCEDGILRASAPEILSGLLEVRGVGIVSMPVFPHADIVLAVRLSNERKIERMPDDLVENINGTDIPLLLLNPFEISATDKIIIKFKTILAKLKEKD